MNSNARLTYKSKKFKDGSFSELNMLKKNLIQQGYNAADLHVGYACAKGFFYCKSCENKVINPPSDWYQGTEFWKCKTCGQINYIIIKS